MAIVDNFTEEELRQIVAECKSFRELNKKLGYSCATGNNNDTIKKRLVAFGITTEHFQTGGQKGITRTEENVFCKDSTATQSTLRKWFTKGEYVPYQCDCCGISEWQGKELVLQLDHINGDNHDNRLENLHWLCPNCHSQTDTFCGKQVKKKTATSKGIRIKSEEEKHNYCIDCGKEITLAATRCPECAKIATRQIDRPSKKELYHFLIEYKGNFTAVGRYYGTTDNNVRKWCKGYNLPTHSKDYKSKIKIQPKEKTDEGLPKSVIQLDKNTLEELQTFDSMYDAARYLIENGYTTDKSLNGVASHIGQVCNGQRNSAYKFKWKLNDG